MKTHRDPILNSAPPQKTVSFRDWPNLSDENKNIAEKERFVPAPRFEAENKHESNFLIEVQADKKINSEPKIPAIAPDVTTNDGETKNVLIWGKIQNQAFQVLVDTGAAVTVISEQFFNDILRAYILLERSEAVNCVRTANGNTISVKGSVTFPILLGDEEYSCKALVVPGLAYSVVLGRDFLHESEAIINVRAETVTFRRTNKVAFVSSDFSPFVSGVRTNETFVIEGNSETILPAQLSVLASQPVVGLIEANSGLSSSHRLLAASCLASVENEGLVSVRLLNPSCDPVILHKGTNIGLFVESDPADIILPMDPGPNDVLPDLNCFETSLANRDDNFLSSFPSLPSSDLKATESAALNDLLLSYRDIFASSSLDLGHTSVIEHRIDTGDARPIKQAPYRVSHTQRSEIDKHVSNMLKQDIIKVSSSPWSSPVVLVRKKDGSTRFCVDYRKLNAVTKKDSYPLPRIDDALDALSGSKIFTTLDLQSGYFQVSMHPDSVEKTAFISHAGLYEYNVMSFGLTNAPSTFQRLMSRVVHGLEWKICLIYIDDIIVFSSSFDEHLNRLRLVFDRLRQANLKLKPGKCHFASSSVRFLGFVVSSSGIAPDPDKISAVQTFPVPTSVTEVRSFLGLCNYDRRFVKGFARIASPLHRLTRKDASFIWDSDCQSAFESLKLQLCSAPILAYPDFTMSFHLYTDASQSAVGYILGQCADGREHVVAYGGRELNTAERKYSTTEREALAVVEGIKHYRSYVTGTKFYVHTDHGCLSWLMKMKDPTGRLARWSLQLQQYDFDIIHRAGTLNGNADALSRRHYTSSLLLPVAALDSPCPPLPTLYNLQRRDADLSAVIDFLERDVLPADNSKARSLILEIDDYYLDESGILCHLWSPSNRRVKSLCSQIVVPVSLRHEILTAFHDDPTAAHFSVFKTYEKVRARFYWHGMFKDVEHWCKSCIDCAMKKIPRHKRKAPLLPIPVEGAFDRVAMDILGPFPVTTSGNRYIIVFSDYYTRWPEAFALPSTEATRIATLIVNEIMARHSSPRTFLSDRGSNFLASIVKEVCRIINTRQSHTTAYHPQTDGLVERFNGTLAEALSMYVSTHQKDWDQHLHLVLFAYRVSPNATTQESPFYLLYGREPRLPIDVSLLIPPSSMSSSVAELRSRIVENLENAQRIIQSNTQLAQQRMKTQYDKTSCPVPYDIGSKVWVFTPKTRKGLSKKLSHNYHGPYRIVARLSPVHFKLRTLDNQPVSVPVHANRMKPYYEPSSRPIDIPPDIANSPDLSESDLPYDSFDVPSSAPESNPPDPSYNTEPPITRPEDLHAPAIIQGI